MARFLELDSLIQSCEDMIIDSLSLETILPILKWSEQPHGYVSADDGHKDDYHTSHVIIMIMVFSHVFYSLSHD